MVTVSKRIYALFIVFSVTFAASGAAVFLVSFVMKSMTSNYPGTEAVISSIEKKAEDDEPTVMIDYSVNRRAYHEELGYYSSSYKAGDKIYIRYDPEDPTEVYVKESFTLFMVLGAVFALVGGILSWFTATRVQRC